MTVGRDDFRDAAARLQEAAAGLFELMRKRYGEDLPLECIIEHGEVVLFAYHLPGIAVWSASRRFLRTADEVADFIMDPVKFYAAEHGVTREQYLQFMESAERHGFYTVSCAARTRRGSRCKKSAATARTVKEWVALQGSVCEAHSGG
jgi:hypothetical protein